MSGNFNMGALKQQICIYSKTNGTFTKCNYILQNFISSPIKMKLKKHFTKDKNPYYHTIIDVCMYQS